KAHIALPNTSIKHLNMAKQSRRCHSFKYRIAPSRRREKTSGGGYTVSTNLKTRYKWIPARSPMFTSSPQQRDPTCNFIEVHHLQQQESVPNSHFARETR